MIHELRRYTIKPGKLADYVEKSGSVGRAGSIISAARPRKIKPAAAVSAS